MRARSTHGPGRDSFYCTGGCGFHGGDAAQWRHQFIGGSLLEEFAGLGVTGIVGITVTLLELGNLNRLRKGET